MTVNFVLNGTHPHRGSTSKGPAAKTSIKRMPENFMLDPDTVDRLHALSNKLELNTPLSSSAFDVNEV